MTGAAGTSSTTVYVRGGQQRYHYFSLTTDDTTRKVMRPDRDQSPYVTNVGYEHGQDRPAISSTTSFPSYPSTTRPTSTSGRLLSSPVPLHTHGAWRPRHIRWKREWGDLMEESMIYAESLLPWRGEPRIN